jgi:hypothetical protein
VIADCYCGGKIRDCTSWVWEPGMADSIPVLSWYHTATGYETCKDGQRAWPLPHLASCCPKHADRAEPGCLFCLLSHDLMLYYHNIGRCVHHLCPFAHAQILDGGG